MDDQLTISTPEQVAFHYEVAGIGTRFVPALLDHLIIFTSLFLIGCAAQTFFIGSLFSGVGSDAGTALLAALMVLIYFAIFWGYFVLFETLWNGQTPGKRSGHIRVIRRDGQPVRAGEVMIRNLVRIVDFLPSLYGIGLMVMFIDKDARRLGDMAAGTIVVREGEHISLQDVRVVPVAATQPVYGSPGYSGTQGVSEYGAVAPYNPASPHSGGYAPQAPAAPRYDPLPGISLRDVSPTDYLLIRELLARWGRGELNHDRAANLARTLAEGVASRMGQDFREWQAQGWDSIAFLQSVLIAKDARE